MQFFCDGMSECRKNGMSERRNVGMSECRKDGMLECRNVGMSEREIWRKYTESLDQSERRGVASMMSYRISRPIRDCSYFSYQRGYLARSIPLVKKCCFFEKWKSCRRFEVSRHSDIVVCVSYLLLAHDNVGMTWDLLSKFILWLIALCNP